MSVLIHVSVVFARLHSFLPQIKEANDKLPHVTFVSQPSNPATFLEMHDEEEEDVLDPQLMGDEEKEHIAMVRVHATRTCYCRTYIVVCWRR